MDVLKLAFETTIVGISAFLWLGIAIDLISPTFLSRVRSTLDGAKNQSLTGAVLLATAYCLGSAILPISDQLVNDAHWFLPEDGIRCRVAIEEENALIKVTSLPVRMQMDTNVCACSYWDRLRSAWDRFRGGTHATGKNSSAGSAVLVALTDAQRRTILTKFDLLESRALGQDANKEELFRQLRERTIVLRGAVFSGFVLFLICLFGWLAPQRGQPFNWRRKFLGIILAASVFILAMCCGYQDLQKPTIFDIPILEAVVAAIALFGGYLAVIGVRRRPFLRIQFLVVILLGWTLAYGGWMWSEILYDQQVISSSAVPWTGSEPSTIHAGLFADGPASKSSSPESVHQGSEIP